MSSADPHAHTDGHEHRHERRFPLGPDRLRTPERIALLERERVLLLCTEGVRIAIVLDVGTGTGVFAEVFAGASLRVTGIDPNAGFLEVARRLVPGVEFLEGTVERLPFKDGAFDLVFLGKVLHDARIMCFQNMKPIESIIAVPSLMPYRDYFAQMPASMLKTSLAAPGPPLGAWLAA